MTCRSAVGDSLFGPWVVVEVGVVRDAVDGEAAKRGRVVKGRVVVSTHHHVHALEDVHDFGEDGQPRGVFVDRLEVLARCLRFVSVEAAVALVRVLVVRVILVVRLEAYVRVRRSGNARGQFCAPRIGERGVSHYPRG